MSYDYVDWLMTGLFAWISLTTLSWDYFIWCIWVFMHYRSTK